MSKLSKKKVIAAIENSGGIVSNIARNADVSRTAIYKFLKKYPDLVDLIQEEKDQVSDMAENQLIVAIQNGEPWGVKYWLSTQVKSRFSYRLENTGKDGGPIETRTEQVFDLGNGVEISF